MTELELALITIGDLELSRRRLLMRIQELEAKLVEKDLDIPENEQES